MKYFMIITSFIFTITLPIVCSADGCSKEEIIKLINAGYSKPEIDEICTNQGKKNSVNSKPSFSSSPCKGIAPKSGLDCDVCAPYLTLHTNGSKVCQLTLFIEGTVNNIKIVNPYLSLPQNPTTGKSLDWKEYFSLTDNTKGSLLNYTFTSNYDTCFTGGDFIGGLQMAFPENWSTGGNFKIKMEWKYDLEISPKKYETIHGEAILFEDHYDSNCDKVKK